MLKRAPAALTTFAALFLTAGALRAQSFGSGIAVSGGDALVGEPGGPTSPGQVWVYRAGTDGWSEAGAIRPSDSAADDGFGAGLAIAGGRMFVVGSAAVYVFERSGDGWTESARIPIDAEISSPVVAFDGEVALVGSHPNRFRRGGGEPGRVRVFRRGSDGSWTASTLTPAGGGQEGDGFGAAIARVGEAVAIGAPGLSAGGERGAGAVFLFERGDTGGWSQTDDPLALASSVQGGGFGSSLLAAERDGETSLFVTAGGTGAVGAVYEFRRDDDGGWSRAAMFLPPVVDGRRPSFGSSLALVDGELWIGGAVDEDAAGTVYRYAASDAGWSFAGSLTPEGPARNARFGSSLVVGDGIALVGAGSKDYGLGTVYVLERSGSGWAQADEVWSEPAGYAAVTGGEETCEDGTASAFECSEVDILSFLPVRAMGAGRGVRVNDVWGWTDPQTGREYALVGMTDQASFIDITDPENPRYVGRLPMTETATGSTWRDIKVYDDHAFIVSDGAGEHGMQVFDLTRLRDVGSEPVTFDADALYDGIASAHNIVINESSGFAYSVGSSGGGETCGGGLHMIDVRTPEQPTFAGCFADDRTGRRNTGYSHDALCLEYHGPDAEHAGREICFGSNETALSISDVSDKENPVALSFAAYPDVGYAHQGWVTEDHRYFYMDDELDEIADGRDGTRDMPGTRTLIWDITDLDDPVLVKEHFGEVFSSDHNLYIRDGYAYQSNYQSGLRILDVRDPENPREVAYLDTVPYADGEGFGGSWSNYPYFESGTIIVTSGNEGLFMVRHRQPELVP